MRKITIIIIGLILLTVGCGNDVKSEVIIKGYYDEPVSLSKEDTIILDGLSNGEYIEIIIEGEITNFEHVKLKWDNEKNRLVEDEIINSFDKLIDKTIVIKTYMPDGIPSEKIKWESLSGETHEFIIAENNLKDE